MDPEQAKYPIPAAQHGRRGRMVPGDRDGRSWRIGTDAEVAWIANGTSDGKTITAAIPPVFEAYATVVLPHG